MEPIETIYVETESIACDGGGALGHPRVFLSLAGRHMVDCPYCGRRYILKEAAGANGGQEGAEA